jgi:septum site-determining protein MinD
LTRIIACASGKGGVGKTTLVANLGIALAKMGKNVVILDANLTTPNLGLHLGIPLFPKTLHDVLKGKARMHEAIYRHESGLKVVPAGIALKDLKGVDARDLPNVLLDLLGRNVDIILLDASAGLGREALSAIESSDEMLLITNPDLPSAIDALKATKLAEQVGTKVIGLVLNRVTKKSHELSRKEIKNILDDIEILAMIPEDVAVKEAVSKRTPVYLYKPRSKASKAIKNLAAKIVGVEYIVDKPWHLKLFGFLFTD